MSNASWVAQTDAIFRSWLHDVAFELRGRDIPIPVGAAFDAWRDGYSVAEFVIQLEGKS